MKQHFCMELQLQWWMNAMVLILLWNIFHNGMFLTDFIHHPQQQCIQFLFTLGYDTYTSRQDNPYLMFILIWINPLNAELNPICHLLALLGAQHILHISRIGLIWWKTCKPCDIHLLQRTLRPNYVRFAEKTLTVPHVQIGNTNY